MKLHVEKAEKVALCRVCKGTGVVQDDDYKPTTCTQCEGSGRVWVGAKTEFSIRPYKPKR